MHCCKTIIAAILRYMYSNELLFDKNTWLLFSTLPTIGPTSGDHRFAHCSLSEIPKNKYRNLRPLKLQAKFKTCET